MYKINKIKEINKPSYKKLIKYAKYFSIKKINMSFYNDLLKFYIDDKLIAIVNYCITPSMIGKDKLFIRNLYCNETIYLNEIVIELCNYCKTKDLIILASIDNNRDNFTKECIKSFYDNNFKGKDIIIYTY
jgi:hypothetical protein